MMTFLLRNNRRVRLQLFLGMLFLVGVIPGGSEALKCYHCEGKASCEIPSKKDCESGEVCGEEEVETGTIIKLDCITKEMGDCLTKGTTSICHPIDSTRRETCISDSRWTVSPETNSFCACDTDLCNELPQDGKGFGEQGNKGNNRASFNGKIILAMTTCPILYGYLRGGDMGAF